MGQIVIGPHDAFIPVDLEREFGERTGKLYVSGVPGEVSMGRMVANIETLLEMPFGRVIPTKDMHPGNHIEHGIYGEHCVMGTRGCEIIPQLARKFSTHPKCHYSLHKGHDARLIGYSMGFSQDFPLFIEDMRRNEFERLFFAGLAFTHCEGESAIDCARQLFKVFIIRDASRSIPPPNGNVEVMERKLKLYGVETITMADLA
jgi:nicotinamidase/pyrazinamidase